MKIKKMRSNKKTFIVILVATILIAAIGVAAYVLYENNKSLQDAEKRKQSDDIHAVNYDPPTEEEKKLGEQAKRDFIENQDDTGSSDAAQSKQSSITITNTTQEGSMLKIRTTVQVDQGNESCELILSKVGQSSIDRTVGIQDYGSYSVCEGFDIDTANIQKGTWAVTLRYTGDPAGIKTTRTVEIR